MPHSQARQIALDEGRLLGWSEFGDPAGRPLLYCHGLPGSRLEAGLTDAAARRLGIRVIAADRPGYGLSDDWPGRTLGDWPADLLQLADALGLGRFALLGVSGGVPYAAAFAALFPERLSAVGLVAGVAPPLAVEGFAAMRLPARLAFLLARRSPALLRLLYGRLAGGSARRFPGTALALLTVAAPAADRRALRRPEVGGILHASIAEAFRHGPAGALRDLELLARPWAVPLAGIRLPVQLWHGEADATVPVAMGRWLAREIPGCRARFLPDEGHFSLPVNHMDEILGRLVAAA
ncbi:alpha/beta hydrolase [Desulfuromonas versatilis]|uniref:Alpha/beta hydrolase n=1 Tax=Desulfuromonas versatilis TaxID=2802975 RepID=A0ABN6E129_9BACT|nr:alpha/beta fold hydrolase [Desulfuromonas versatilis]BCR06042.1 alpha/beta hydrolase [Desulfuromonas versatilis]